jgi:hypothetical protein
VGDNSATVAATDKAIPFIITYNPALHGQNFSFLSIKTKTSEQIPLLEIVIPYKGYPEFDLFWETRSVKQLNRTINMGTRRNKIKYPIQSPIQLVFNQRYSAAKSRTNNNRNKRTQRANILRNRVIKPNFKTHLPNLQKFEKYYTNSGLDIEEPKEYPYLDLVRNVVPPTPAK